MILDLVPALLPPRKGGDLKKLSSVAVLFGKLPY